ncbi:RNA polymerase subunit sigma-70 [Mycobacteroides abscessus]|uniref:RNA polymerase subunit sigma-70 n=1 Tax=Mycobacteroides abscessus TaxID=36809 RepID=UPI001926F62B|nr:RNA polymerase subunit sigma-70 [Mycobacteroides abscessus]MBL3752908.1 RNA polymerase subunit sigma-70 [Mycobacteroides abscessus subsp. massiliense]
MRPHTETNWREPTYTDDGLEQVVDTAAADTLMSRIAIALATSTALKGRPDAVMRNWRVLMARMDGQTLDQIAAAEGRSREWIRQILRQTRQIVSAKPGLFDGHGGLDHAARCQVWNCRRESRSWRLGYTNDPPKTVGLAPRRR